ncbi:hypothetical protein RhiirA5_496488 [Rhizophagus irregularis]|uniref:Uncharacterized protein n=1 Tax=Rhizophagus irregularis TaxID=588596 RepID=A0A2N0Q1W1_9GLOM|nr:hypothetical protein RhiirA5_496488 [Rhizophagus irregularis]
MAQLADSVMGLLRLNEEGSSKFLQMNHSVFFRNMAQEFLKQFHGGWQYDPSTLIKKKDTVNKKCPRFVETPKNFCAYSEQQRRQCNWYVAQEKIIPFDKRQEKPLKYYELKPTDEFTALTFNEYTSLIDESTPFTMTLSLVVGINNIQIDKKKR